MALASRCIFSEAIIHDSAQFLSQHVTIAAADVAIASPTAPAQQTWYGITKLHGWLHTQII